MKMQKKIKIIKKYNSECTIQIKNKIFNLMKKNACVFFSYSMCVHVVC